MPIKTIMLTTMDMLNFEIIPSLELIMADSERESE